MLGLCFAGGIACGAGGIHGGQEVCGHPSRIRESSPPEQPVGHYLAPLALFSLSQIPTIQSEACCGLHHLLSIVSKSEAPSFHL